MRASNGWCRDTDNQRLSSGFGDSGMMEWPRLVVTAAILLAFGWAIGAHWSNGLEETLKNLAVMAVGYWLGSSRGAQSQTENVGKALDVATANSPILDPTVTLKPGETAQAEEEK